MTPQEPAMGVSDEWPEYLMLRDTKLHDDMGGLGQRIFTTAGAGYEKRKYVRADLAALPHMQPAGEAVVWKCEWIEDGEVTWAQFHDASNPMPEKWDCPPDRITAYTTPPQPSAEEASTTQPAPVDDGYRVDTAHLRKMMQAGATQKTHPLFPCELTALLDAYDAQQAQPSADAGDGDSVECPHAGAMRGDGKCPQCSQRHASAAQREADEG